jgi:hypothetical protein
VSQVNRQPCNSLQVYRATVAKIEESLDTANARRLTAIVLSSYEKGLRNIIKVIRDASDDTIGRCMRSKSRSAVLDNIREARDQLNLAIMQLEQRDEKGKNNQFFRNIRMCRGRLEDALRNW